MSAVEKCGVQYGQHPTMPHLVAVCAKDAGHNGAHSNVLPKTPYAAFMATVVAS